MAMPYQTPWDPDPVGPGLEVDIKDIAIGGKLVRVTDTFTDWEFSKMQNDAEFKKHVKHALATQLATIMLEANLLEFTTFKDASSLHTKVAVRGYLAPNDQVKLLRIHTQ